MIIEWGEFNYRWHKSKLLAFHWYNLNNKIKCIINKKLKQKSLKKIFFVLFFFINKVIIRNCFSFCNKKFIPFFYYSLLCFISFFYFISCFIPCFIPCFISCFIPCFISCFIPYFIILFFFLLKNKPKKCNNFHLF